MTDPSPTPETRLAKTNWLTGGRAGYLALGLSVVALGLATAPWFTGGNVRAYLLAHPEVLQEASQALQDKEAQARVDVINDLAQAYASQGKEGEARLASAEYYFAAGRQDQATQFALRARSMLDPGTIEWRRAVDIVLASGATPEDLKDLDRRDAARRPTTLN